MSIEGTVVDAATGVPLPNWPVALQQTLGEQQTKTDETGRYKFVGNFSGSVRVGTSDADGYMATGRLINLSQGSTVGKVNLKVAKGAVISGRVFNAEKKPISGASVHISSEGYRAGRPVLLSSRTFWTNDEGEFSSAKPS